jgi:hypothetical protein
MGPPLTQPETYTLDVPGAVLHYDVREAEASTVPILLMIGLPMDASGFTSLREHFRDRTVVTYDPRRVGRSKRTDDASETTPEEHADDLHRLLAALGGGPVTSSPAAAVPSTRSPWWPGTRSRCARSWRTSRRPPRSCRTASRRGGGGGHPPDLPAGRLRPGDGEVHRAQQPAGGGSGRVRRPARESGRVRAGAELEGELAHRAAVAVAERLGTKAVTFPSHHGGFLGGEYGMKGDPDAFAVTLRQILTEEG